VSQAHVCLLYPLQRGNITNINQAGDKECYLVNTATNAPICGSDSPIKPEIPKLVLEGGSMVTFVWQKNLNHWVANVPGNFTVFLIDELFPEMITTLASIPDTNTPALTIYSTTVQLPRYPVLHGYVGVTYYGAEVGVTFFQCSDVVIV